MLCTIPAAFLRHGRDFQRTKTSFFVHVSFNEMYLNRLTMEQLQTDIACLSQCCNVQQLLHRYVGMYEIESRDTRVCLAIGSRSPRIFHAAGFVFYVSDNTIVSRLICYTKHGYIDHICICNPIFKPGEVRRWLNLRLWFLKLLYIVKNDNIIICEFIYSKKI